MFHLVFSKSSVILFSVVLRFTNAKLEEIPLPFLLLLLNWLVWCFSSSHTLTPTTTNVCIMDKPIVLASWVQEDHRFDDFTKTSSMVASISENSNNDNNNSSSCYSVLNHRNQLETSMNTKMRMTRRKPQKAILKQHRTPIYNTHVCFGFFFLIMALVG